MATRIGAHKIAIVEAQIFGNNLANGRNILGGHAVRNQKRMDAVTRLGATCIAATVIIGLSACNSKNDETTEAVDAATVGPNTGGSGSNDSAELSREDAVVALKGMRIEEGSKFRINGSDVAPIFNCMESNGAGRSQELTYEFDLDPTDSNGSGFRFENFWRDRAHIENPGASQQTLGYAYFDLPAALSEIKVSGIAPPGSGSDQSNKIIEYTANVIFPGQSFQCLEGGVPISGKALAQKYDDGWRASFDANAFQTGLRF